MIAIRWSVKSLCLLAVGITVSIFFAIVTPEASAADATLAWNPNQESDLAGYKIHYGTASYAYQNVLDIGKKVTHTLTGLEEGKTYYFALTAYNSSGLSSGFSNEVSYSAPAAGGTQPPPPDPGGSTGGGGDSGSGQGSSDADDQGGQPDDGTAAGGTELIIDNKDPETTAVGSWPASNGPNPFEGESVFSKSTSGTFTFQADVSGPQEVYLWWTEYSNRNTKVPVRIYDGTTLIDTINVDQTKNGGKWYLLGSYTFSGSARVMVMSTSKTYTTCADAVRFISGSEPDPVPETAEEMIIDNNDPETTAVGSWPASNGPNSFEGESVYCKTTSGTFTFQADVSGLQKVYLWWTEYSNRSTKVPVRIYDGTTLIATVNVDQTKNGGKWYLLGSYTFSGPARVMIMSTSKTYTTCADAVRFITGP